MKHKILLVLLLLLLPAVFGYEIVGNTVIFENEFAKLEVSPHTDVNFQKDPSILPTFEQTFKITNKTDFDRNLFFAFVFNKPLLSAKAFNLEPVIKTRDSYGWVSKSFQCNHDFNYSLNVNPDSVNPHILNCFDINAELKITYYKKDFAFYSGDLPSRTVNYYEWDVNGTEEYSEMDYVNRSSYFNSYFSPYKNKAYYYIDVPYKFEPHGSNEFKIFYKPDPSDKSNKWDLIAWSGDSWDCILFDSCDAVYLLDPNWQNLTASTRYPINISVGATATDTNTTHIYSGNITDFGLTVADDVNRILIYDQDKNIEISRVIDLNRDTGDINIFFIPLIPLAPNTDYNGTDYNGLMAYILDANYADQNESWNQSFWFGTNFEIAAERGTWDATGDNDTWSYFTGNQFDGTTGTVKKVLFNGVPQSDARLQNFYFPLSSDYNIFVQADINTTYWGKLSFHNNGYADYTNQQDFEMRSTAGNWLLQVYNPSTSTTFGSSSGGDWYRVFWNIGDANQTASVFGQAGTTTFRNTTTWGGFFALRMDSLAGYFSEFDNLRIYKKLLNPPVITLGAAENQSASPDVNLNYPVGAETFYKTSTYDINFSITDADSSSWLVDLNIFQDSNQVSVIDDVNTDSATITCTGSDCIYSLTVPEGWVSGDWNMLVFVSDGTNTAQDATASVFTITTIPEPAVNPETSERFYTEEDPRFFDSNRFYSPEDERLDDTNRFYEQDDYRQETSILNKKSLNKANPNIIIVVLVIILIALAVFLWKRK